MYFLGKIPPKVLGDILDEGWLTAFLAALFFHISVFVLIYWSPSLFESHHTLPTVYTVRLFEASLPAMHPSRHSNTGTAHKPTHKIKKGGKKTILTRAPTRRRKVTPRSVKSHAKTAKKLLSLKPKRIASKRIVRSSRTKVKKKTRDTEKLLNSRLKKIQERVEEKRAEAKLDQRLAALKAKVKKAKGKDTEKSGAIAPLSGNASLDKVLKDYCAMVWQQVRYHWNFPEELMRSPSMECTISIRIAGNGKILGTSYEKRSGHDLLDETALRAILESDPLPPLPAPLLPGPIEIGIRFKPGEE